MTKLTDAQTSTLQRGAQHVGGFISPAPKTPSHMAHTQAYKLAVLGLVQEAPCFHDEPFYSRDEDTGDCVGYRLTAAGFEALGIDQSEWPAYCTQDPDADPEPAGSMHADDGLVVVEAAEPFGEHPLPAALEQTMAAVDGGTSLVHMAAAAHDAGFEVTMELVKPAHGGHTGALGGDATQDDAQGQGGAEAAQDAPTATTKGTLRGAAEALRDAAAAVLVKWDDRDLQYGLDAAIENLRAALALVEKPAKPAREAGAERAPREGTKQQRVIDMLRAEGGASNAQIQDATSWAPHSVRGFLAALKKKGFDVRSTKEGSEMIYRIAA
jgi:hypothetical protein